MADDAKIGTDWQDDELDVIVADYFAMLAEDLAGRPYVKLRHSTAIMAQIGRTHRSVEFKHQNISAVMDELGMPWIPGYKPKRNYQNAIFDAIDRYLTKHPSVLEPAAIVPVPSPAPAEIFVPTPTLTVPSGPVPERLRRLVQKFDPVKGTIAIVHLARLGRPLSLMSRGVSSLMQIAWIWPGKSGGPPPKMETVQVTIFFRSTGQVPSA
jgi:hypothetical protein